MKQNIISMHLQAKSTLKNNRYHNIKQALQMASCQDKKNLVIGLLLDFIKRLFGFFWFSKRLKLKGF